MKKQMKNFHKKNLCKNSCHIWQFKHKNAVWNHQKCIFVIIMQLKLNMIIFEIFSENAQHEKIETLMKNAQINVINKKLLDMFYYNAKTTNRK